MTPRTLFGAYDTQPTSVTKVHFIILYQLGDWWWKWVRHAYFGQNVDGEMENATYALGILLQSFPREKIPWWLFVVYANSTVFSSSNFFVSITHRKVRYNSPVMYFWCGDFVYHTKYLCIGEFAMWVIISKENFGMYHEDCGSHNSSPNFWLGLVPELFFFVKGARPLRPGVLVPEVLCASCPSAFLLLPKSSLHC